MFKEAEDLLDELRKLQLQAERHFSNLLAPSKAHPAAEGKWQPLADIYETNEAWVIRLELSGVRKEDFSVSVSDGILTIRGTRKDEFAGKWRTFRQAEIHYNEFSRSFSLPERTDPGNIKAVYKDGLLTITIEKTASPPEERKKIAIKIT